MTETDPFKRAYAAALARQVEGIDEESLLGWLEKPARPEHGDYALPCFRLSKVLRRNPAQIASELAAALEGFDHRFAAVSAVGPFLNAKVRPAAYVEATLRASTAAGEAWGETDQGGGARVCLDYSSPNIAKPFHIGHLRSTIIGAALYRIYRALGYQPVGINHLGDWGTQFGKMMAAFTLWTSPSELEQAQQRGETIDYLTDLYVRFHQAAKEEPSLDDQGRDWFRRLEEGDVEAEGLWQRFRSLSLEEFKRIYRRLDVDFESWDGESFYNDKMDETAQRLEELGLLVESEDAQIVDLSEWDLPPGIVRKSDGATTYFTRDLAAARYRYATYAFAESLYVVGAPQKLHFHQLFKTLELMGCDWVDRCAHVDFGHYHGMKTREGTAVRLAEVLDRAVELARALIDENLAEGRIDLGDATPDEVAEAVGIGAVIFNDLKNRRHKDVQFDWERMLNWKGETGPYLQYTHARTAGILRKYAQVHSGNVQPEVAFSRLDEPETVTLAQGIGDYPRVIQRAARDHEPSFIANHLLEVASAFNTFYHQHQVVSEDAELSQARILLIDRTRQVLKHGLEILGIQAPERM